jgi:nicotinamidase-related amidase
VDNSDVAVLVIDMQNAYFEDDALRSRQDGLVASCNRLIDGAAAREVPVLMVCTEHQRDKSTWTLSMLDDDQGFIFAGSGQADFVPGLRHEGLPRVVKTRDSAFMGTDLLLRLRNFGASRLVLAGVATHNCVAQTAADAFASNFRVAYAKDAMASTNEEYAEAMRRILSDEYRQPVLAEAEVEKLLAESRGRQ